MAGDVIDFRDRAIPQPRWGGLVTLEPGGVMDPPGTALAALAGFWGGDEYADSAERMEAWADALERLAKDMRGAAAMMRDPG